MNNQEITPIISRKEKLVYLINEMNKGLLERNEQVKLMLLAAIAGEHILLIGPPGTAKSELAKRLKSVFIEANYFERLLTRFSVPEELFGPLSIKALEEDSYKRLTSGYLPEASIAFIDEIFKANSAILNSLLTLLNEREFDNGNRRYKVPLISVVAASNELPEGEELSALYDRFMLRSFVSSVSSDSFQDLLTLSPSTCDPELEYRLKIEDINEVQQLSEKVHLGPSVIELCKVFREYLQGEDIYVSDRRWRKIIKLMKVSAFTTGQNEVSNYDAWILPHCLWNKPEEFQGLKDLYENNIAISGDFNNNNLADLILFWDDNLKTQSSQKGQKYDNKGQSLFIDDQGNETIKSSGEVHKKNSNGELLFYDRRSIEETTNKEKNYYNEDNKPILIDMDFKPAMEIIKYSKYHIKGKLKEILYIKNSTQSHIDELNKTLGSAKIVFDNHIWLNKALLPLITASYENALTHTQNQLSKLENIEAGFAKLPVEDESAFIGLDDDALEGEICE